MADTVSFPKGNYDFIRGVFQYSSAVRSAPGFNIVRVRFEHLVPMAEGFCAVAGHLKSVGRPVTALCALELRSPAAFTESEFDSLNREYVAGLRQWGFVYEGENPVARTNVCPEIRPPAQVGVYAFCYTVPDRPSRRRRDFVIAGSGEAPEGKENYRDHVVRPGDISAGGLAEKARWVLGELERRMACLELGWPDATATQLYTVHDVHPFAGSEIALRGAMNRGLTWHYARPPVIGLDYEMDVRGVTHEFVI